MHEADRLGLEMGLNMQSGYNLGGPLVTPERAAKLVTHSEVKLLGPRQAEMALPLPKSEAGFYRDIAVVAYREKAAGVDRPRRSQSRSTCWNPRWPCRKWAMKCAGL